MSQEKEYLLDIAPADRQVRFKIAKDTPWNVEVHFFSDSFSQQIQLYMYGGETLRHLGQALIDVAPEVDRAIEEGNRKGTIAQAQETIRRSQKQIQEAEAQLRELQGTS